MLKLVIFDLDGVLVDLKDCHYRSLNLALEALSKNYIISLDEHYKCYDGLPTKEKLKMLSKFKKLDENKWQSILEKKQIFTLKYVYESIKPNKHITDLLQKLKNDGYKTCVASNSVSNTIYCVLANMKILHLIDHVISNEHVKYSKPNPEIYFKAISYFGLTPQECLIVEDSPYGLEAAYQSGANILRVNNSFDVNIHNVFNKITQLQNNFIPYKWKDKRMNILIPMAGAGSRFEQAGYMLPKPLINVNGKPMIEHVIKNLNIDANFTFIVQENHEKKFGITKILQNICNNCNVVITKSLTEGAACTALLAKDHIDNDLPLLIANSDQIIDWNSNNFYYKISSQEYQHIDASILTFRSTHPKWSFVKTDDQNYVTQVAEKNPISDIATAGIYFWKKGSEFVKYANQMIEKNIRVNNEFYIAPVFNEAILDNKKISIYDIDKMWGLGTPEDLENYLNNNKI